MKKIGIVILNYNDSKTTIELLKKICNFKIECIVVVDNNSTDNSYDILSGLTDTYKFVLLKSDRNGGYSYGNNIGLRYLIDIQNVDIAIIANPDVIFEEEILFKIREYLSSHPLCGLVSPKMVDNNGKVMRMWLKLPIYLNSILDCSFIGRQLNKLLRKTNIDEVQTAQRVDILPGSLLAFKSSALKAINYLDENVFLYYEENIIGERLKTLGVETILLTNCSYIHNHSVTIKKNLSILNAFKCNLKSKLYFEKTYHKINKFQELTLRLLMKYAIFEMRIILELRSLLGI